jgi:hypothetical protein
MEVHHHPDLHHKPKPWKEYLLEYLMIFLAVMTGFFAESYREHLGEKGKAREYARSMISDLKTDTANLKGMIRITDYAVTGLDSLIVLLQAADRDKHGSDLYYLARGATFRFNPFRATERTYNEMRSSGNLRLVGNEVIDNDISKYYYDLEDWKQQNVVIEQLMFNYFNSVSKVFDASVFQKLVNDPRFKFPNLPRPNGNPVLASTSKADITELVGSTHYLYSREKFVSLGATPLLEQAANLIKMLKKEYHLDDE